MTTQLGELHQGEGAIAPIDWIRPPLPTDPGRPISRQELQDRLDRGDDFRLVVALNEWAF